ncbi:MAG TPA: hypothetical protein VLB68_01640, partial [Pyrinomonadaceae bacterium]|nr:hypothetical protein [Pyrinomonadaceae bacterium]
MKRLTILFLFTFLSGGVIHAQNWPQFRGPSATGVAEGATKPVKFDASKSENVVWKTAIPGLSHASPIVWGNKVFVVTAVSSEKDETRYGLYGDVAPVKNDPKHSWKLYALDKQKGTILWERV